jgi:hypothetical protein
LERQTVTYNYWSHYKGFFTYQGIKGSEKKLESKLKEGRSSKEKKKMMRPTVLTGIYLFNEDSILTSCLLE